VLFHGVNGPRGNLRSDLRNCLRVTLASLRSCSGRYRRDHVTFLSAP
jgi:hypothetical protein